MLGMARHLADRGHQPFLAARPGTQLLQQAGESGLPALPLAISGDLNPILLFRLAALLRKHAIEIVIANTARDIRIAGIAARFSGGASVLGLHQVDRPIKNKWNYRLTFNWFADTVVVNSQATKRTLREHNPWLSQDKINVVPHGIDPARYQAGGPKILRSSLGLPPEAFVLGFVGRLSGQKGVSVLLQAMTSIARTHPDVHLVIAGIGTLEKKVREFIKSSGLKDSIHLLGFRDDIPELMPNFDLLLVPSLWEGFGLVVVEGMAAGVPCIASDVSSIPEIIDSGTSGILVPPGDAGALAEAVDRLRRHDALRSRIGQIGRERVEERFTVERMMSTYEKIFADLHPPQR